MKNERSLNWSFDCIFLIIIIKSFSVPWDMQRLASPFGHGFIMSCLAGCTDLNPEIRDLMEEVPGCKLKFRAMMNESRLKIDQIAGFIHKFSSTM